MAGVKSAASGVRESMANGLIRGEPVDDDLYSIQIEGDFDASMRDQGIAVTEAALDEQPKALFVDVKRCTFLDSTAIAVILGARQRALDAGIGFALVGHNPTIDRTLELTGLSEELRILTDRDEAIAQLAPR
jgi:anti-anti-sigma factor